MQKLLDVPKDLSDFVIVHELAHLLAPNHGKVFKSFMHAYLPDWQQRERALRGYPDEQATSPEGSTDSNMHRRTSRLQRRGHNEGSSARRGR